jgi:MoxR-like ATPase
MTNQQNPEYEYPTDELQPHKEEEVNGYYPYIPDPKLVKAVNLAIQLKRPLLIEGEPGCGKTQLAYSLAYQFTQKYLRVNQESDRVSTEIGTKNPETALKDPHPPTPSPKAGEGEPEHRAKSLDPLVGDGWGEGPSSDCPSKIWWNYYVWNVKSNSQARDGLYRFDAVARLRDAQLMGLNPRDLEDLMGKEFNNVKERLRDKTKYVEFGKLGESLHQTDTLRPIVLIDEIDKADNDFCNDLLLELERQYFEIPETGERYPKPGSNWQPKPIVIITSNQERQLPEPFLRRCLYYYLKFPGDIELEKIIYSRFGEKNAQQQQYVDKTIAHFYEIRNLLKGKLGSKLPGTSELLDYLEITLKAGEAELADLETLVEQPHLLGMILKTQTDQELYCKNQESFNYGESE